MAQVAIGWDGKCAEHRNMPSLAKRTPSTIQATNHNRGDRKAFAQILKIHCAAGHWYYAIDLDELIDDPFSEDEEADIYGDEGFPLPPDNGEFE